MSCIIQECLPFLQTLSLQLSPVIVSSSICAVQLSLVGYLLLLLLSHFSSVRLCVLHRQKPTRLLHPWDSPGKNTGVGCHFLLQCRKVKVKSLSRALFAKICHTW